MSSVRISILEQEFEETDFRKRRLKSLFEQLGLNNSKNKYVDKVDLDLFPGLHVLQIKNSNILKQLEQAALGIINNTEIELCGNSFILSGVKPKFARPMYTMQQVLLLYLGSLQTNLDWKKAGKFIKHYIARNNVKKYFVDNVGFDYASFLFEYACSVKYTNYTFLLFDSFNFKEELITQAAAENNILLITRSENLPEGISRTYFRQGFRYIHSDFHDSQLQTMNLQFLEKKNINTKAGLQRNDIRPLLNFDIKQVQIKDKEISNKPKEKYYRLILTIKFDTSVVYDIALTQVLISINGLNGAQFVQMCKRNNSNGVLVFDLNSLAVPEGKYTVFLNLAIDKKIIWKLSPYLNLLVGEVDLNFSRTPYLIEI